MTENQDVNGSGDQNSDDANANPNPKQSDRDYVVSDNKDESEKVELAKKEAVAPAKDTQDQGGNDEDETDAGEDKGDNEDQSDDEDSSRQKKRKRGGFQKKIARLEDEKEYWRKKALGTKDRSLDEQSFDQKKAEDAPANKPTPEDFETYDEYSEALTDWKVDEKLKKIEETRQTETKKSELKTSQETKVKQYEESVVDARSRYDDFDEVVEDYDGPLTIGMQQALLDSELGADVAYYIAQNPKIGEKMAGMTLLQVNKEVGRIEARLENSTGEGKKSAETTKKTSKSPPPITPVKGSSKSKKSPEDQSYEEYLNEREKRRRSF